MAKNAEICDFMQHSGPIAAGIGGILTSGPPEFTTWRAFGISSRDIDPKAPNLHPRIIGEVENPPPPMVGNRGCIGQFYRIPENSRSVFCAEIVKICDFRPIRI